MSRKTIIRMKKIFEFVKKIYQLDFSGGRSYFWRQFFSPTGYRNMRIGVITIDLQTEGTKQGTCSKVGSEPPGYDIHHLTFRFKKPGVGPGMNPGPLNRSLSATSHTSHAVDLGDLLATFYINMLPS